MFRPVLFLGALLLSACAITPPMTTESASNLKNGKSIVAFYDGAEKINYLEDVYLVLAVAKVASNSTYKGIWDSNTFLSSIHAEELSKIGVRSQSIYNVLSEPEIAQALLIQKDMHALYETQQKPSEYKLNDQFRDQLIQKGFSYFIWETWSGYTLYIHALGLPPNESFDTTYWIYDLKQNKMAWNGSITFSEKVVIDGNSGKKFIEKDNLSVLKAHVEKMIRERYKVRKDRGSFNDSVGQIIGLEPKI